MKTEELRVVLENHMKWLRNPSEGAQANLSGANLSGADLSYADLRDAKR